MSEVKKTNRAIQNLHSTYNDKAEISEALHLLKHSEDINLNQSTIKALSHFKYTKTGATQIKITNLCKKVGIATSTYYDYALPQIEGYFDEPLIITIKMPKIDKLGRVNPNGSQFKVLQPLRKIKELIKRKQEEIRKQRAEIMAQFEQSGITGGITGGITPEAETPCESKDEDGFQEEQNKSIRVNPLDKTLSALKDKHIPIPISSDNTQIEYGNQEKEKVDDSFQILSNDLYNSSIIPHNIKMYLKDRIRHLVDINFNVMEYQRFIREYQFVDLHADYDDTEKLNEDHLLWVTDQMINEVDKIGSTYAIMHNWCNRHLSFLKDKEQQEQRQFNHPSWGYNWLEEDGQEFAYQSAQNAPDHLENDFGGYDTTRKENLLRSMFGGRKVVQMTKALGTIIVIFENGTHEEITNYGELSALEAYFPEIGNQDPF